MSAAWGAPTPVMRQTTLTSEPTRTLGCAADSIQTHTLPLGDVKCRTVVVSAAQVAAATRGPVVVVTRRARAAWCELAHAANSRTAMTIARPRFTVLHTNAPAGRFPCRYRSWSPVPRYHSTVAPEPAPGGSRCQLFAQHRAGVRSVGRDHEEAGVSAFDQPVVVTVSVENDVSEQSPVLVALLGIELERNMPAGELRLGEVARRVAEALHRFAGIDDLRRVDTEQSDLFDRPAVEARDNGVAVDDADNCRRKVRLAAGTREPSPPCAPEQSGHRHRHRQHAPN